jgi:hypothetical protein
MGSGCHGKTFIKKKVPLGHVAQQTEARCEGLRMVYKVRASQLMIQRIEQGHTHGHTSSCCLFFTTSSASE